MVKCIRCGIEIEGGDEIKTCPKCGTCYTKNENHKWIHSNNKPDKCVQK
jgi:hypothetical protein